MVEICLIGHFSFATTGSPGSVPGHPRRCLRCKSDELAKTRECQLSHRLDAAAIATLRHGGTLLRRGLSHRGQLVALGARRPRPDGKSIQPRGDVSRAC
jgi:hypothetical protein